MDELEWLKKNSPSTKPSRDVTRRHRTQLRAAIAAEGADGTRPRRPRRDRRSRHRVLFASAAVVTVCAIGIGVVTLSSGGDDDGSSIGAPAGSDTTVSTAPAVACTNPPPQTLAIPEGFGNPVAAPAKDAATAPTAGQQVTSWSSGTTTIEQRWPADAAAAEKYGAIPGKGPADGSSTAGIEGVSRVDANGVARRTAVFTFSGLPPECAHLQVTVSGRDQADVDRVTDTLLNAPFVLREPLVTSTATAASAPGVVACEGVTNPEMIARGVKAVATVGGSVTADAYAKPTDALAAFLPTQKGLFTSGYAELRLPDASITYVKEFVGNAVTTVHVAPTAKGWTVREWQASGC